MLTLPQEAKMLNIPHRNLMSKEDLRKAIKNTIINYKEIAFGVDSLIYIKCLVDIKKQRVNVRKI